MVSSIAVGRAISGNAELVKEVANLTRNNALELKAPEKVCLRLLGRGQQPCFGGRYLSKDLPELAELDQAGVGIVFEVTFGKAAKTYKLGIVHLKKIKIGRYPFHRKRADGK